MIQVNPSEKAPKQAHFDWLLNIFLFGGYFSGAFPWVFETSNHRSSYWKRLPSLLISATNCAMCLVTTVFNSFTQDEQSDEEMSRVVIAAGEGILYNLFNIMLFLQGLWPRSKEPLTQKFFNNWRHLLLIAPMLLPAAFYLCYWQVVLMINTMPTMSYHLVITLTLFFASTTCCLLICGYAEQYQKIQDQAVAASVEDAFNEIHNEVQRFLGFFQNLLLMCILYSAISAFIHLHFIIQIRFYDGDWRQSYDFNATSAVLYSGVLITLDLSAEYLTKNYESAVDRVLAAKRLQHGQDLREIRELKNSLEHSRPVLNIHGFFTLGSGHLGQVIIHVATFLAILIQMNQAEVK